MTLLDDMLALLPDNIAGDISALDMRTIVTDLYNNAQPIDSDLTTIAALTATSDSIMQSKASTWSARTLAQVATDLQGLVTIAESQVTNLVTDLSGKQPIDSDLTAIAALTATTDSIIQSKGSTWTARTVAQFRSDLGLRPPLVIVLTDAATIAVNATLGDRFRVTLTGSHILGNPTGAVDGQQIMFEIIENGTGGWTLTLDTKFNDPNSYYTGVSTGIGIRSHLGVRYNSTSDKFDVLAFAKGY